MKEDALRIFLINNPHVLDANLTLVGFNANFHKYDNVGKWEEVGQADLLFSKNNNYYLIETKGYFTPKVRAKAWEQLERLIRCFVYTIKVKKTICSKIIAFVITMEIEVSGSRSYDEITTINEEDDTIIL